jgi:potassium efflux system protein
LEIDPDASWQEFTRIWGVLTGPGLWSQAGTVKSTVVWSGLLVLVLSFVLGARMRRRLMPASEASFGRALLALLVAILPAAIFLVVAQVIDSLKLPEQLDPPLPDMLRAIALMMFVQRTAVWLLAEHGVAVRFFKQNVNVTKQVLRSIKIATYGAILFEIPAAVLRDDPFELRHLPRILETAWAIAVGLALLLLLSRRGALIQSMTRPEGFLRRLWGIVHPAVALCLVGIVAMDIAGYRVGAAYLMLNTSRTLIALLVLGGLYTALVPLIRTAADRVWRTTLKEEGAAAAQESSSALTEQLTRLVASVLTVVALIALFQFWGFGDTVVRSLEGIQVAEISEDKYLSLWDVFVAVFWIIGGHLVVHNLASFYEYVVFPIIGGTDKGGRFALLTISRYIILVIAYGTAIVTLGFNMQSLGWAFAAVSVGLGFGLQEIVANFISGLVLLFERPIRVGDIITVGETGGTVEKINIRATTVTNWDRQTIVIPNKNFITQNLTNWTHNDRIMRATVNVSVAYGSDVEKVLKLLNDLVAEHPKVLKDPPHRIWFQGFGASSLDFLVWCFTQIDDRLKTASELRVQIYAKFKEEGIVIPFPQTDLHIKTGAEDAALGALLEKRKED